MSNEEPLIQDFDMNLICDYFGRLDRQGPGDVDSTIKALSFIDRNTKDLAIADLACGTGGQTLILAENTKATIIGLDLFPDFIAKLNSNVKMLGIQDRVNGIVGSMDNLPFSKEQFDIVWCEGAIGNIGFKKGLNYWKDFIKKGGYFAVSYETWFTNDRPAEIEKFWTDAVPEITTIENNIKIIEDAGYSLTATFKLPETCWIDSYFKPQQLIQEKFLEDNKNNIKAEEFVKYMKYEFDLYNKYRQFYGYIFYIGKKI